MPVDDSDADDNARKRTKAEIKMARERERRLARKKVQDAIEGWAQLFRGEGGKPYFKVGEVKRDDGWLEKLPRRELCEKAQKQRPKRSQVMHEAGDSRRKVSQQGKGGGRGPPVVI